jgi:hypothetical protein
MLKTDIDTTNIVSIIERSDIDAKQSIFDKVFGTSSDITNNPEYSDKVWELIHNEEKDKLRTLYGQSLFHQDFEGIAFTVPSCSETSVKNKFFNLFFLSKFARSNVP